MGSNGTCLLRQTSPMSDWSVSETSDLFVLAWRDVQRQELSAFDELAGDRVVGLDVEQIPALTEDGGDVDDARRFLVIVERGRRRSGQIPEAFHVVLGHFGERSVLDAVLPDLAEVRLATDVLLQQHVT